MRLSGFTLAAAAVAAAPPQTLVQPPRGGPFRAAASPVQPLPGAKTPRWHLQAVRQGAEEGFKFREFGHGLYPDLYHDLPVTWADIAQIDNLGRACEEGKQEDQCGKELVCREGTCRHCMADKDCSSDRYCKIPLRGRSACVKRRSKAWVLAFTDGSEFTCTVLIFFASMLAAASGLGGGGMFVPLLLLFSNLKAEFTVPLSQCMILCGSVMNLTIFISQRHPDFPAQTKVDYNCAFLLAPLLCFGVILGVFCNQVSPHWFQVVLLCATLGSAFSRTLQKGIRQWITESQNLLQGMPSPRGLSYTDGFIALTNRNGTQVLGIMILWCVMLSLSFHGLPLCSTWYLALVMTVGLALTAATYLISQWIEREAKIEVEMRPIPWASGRESVRYPIYALGAGLLGGLLGLGGGIIMSPVLLEVGMHSEAVQATTALFVFISSSLATIQYAVLQMHVWDYAVWYCFIAVFATVLGQFAVSVLLRKYRRYSIITLAIAGVLLFSLIALSVVGVSRVMEDFRNNEDIGFSMKRICQAGGSIVTVDVRPVKDSTQVSYSYPY